MTTQLQHGMVPGSHERSNGPECRCGGAWNRWDDKCAKQEAATKAFRELEYMVSLGDNDGYLGVINNFSHAEVSFTKHEDVQNTVVLSIDDIKKLIPMLQAVVDGFPEFGGGVSP